MNRIVLCVSDDPSALLLYRSMLELEGDSVLPARNVEAGLRLAKTEMVDCVVVDHRTQGSFLARKIGRRRQSPPIIFVFDGQELPMQIYSDVALVIQRDEAIENLSGCIQQVLDVRRQNGPQGGEVVTEPDTFSCFAPLHRLLSDWLLPW
jgi:DNA-binding NtrC family response regulator